MRKSILLSSFIMLIILFVTLSTSTFAWYQASGGEINISGSSTASVTTTGPNSPYLVISETSVFSKTIEGVSNVAVTQSNYTNFLSITPAVASNLVTEIAYPVFVNGVLNKFVSPIDGDIALDARVLKFTFYLRNIGDMAISANLKTYTRTGEGTQESPYVFNTAVSNNFAYMVELIDGSGNKTYYHTSYKDSSNATVAASLEASFEANTTYQVNYYIWINNDSQFTDSKTVGDNASNLGPIAIKFEDVEIVTSGS